LSVLKACSFPVHSHGMTPSPPPLSCPLLKLGSRLCNRCFTIAYA
jgi:hypothetical protein